MTDIGLTQEQIDAMLGGGDSGGGITSEDLAALADFERETMGNLPSVLNAMTGADYSMENVEFVSTTSEELAALAGDDLIFSIPIDVGEPLTHHMMLEARFSKDVAAALTGGEPGAEEALSEMELSAIQEVISQANGTYLTNLGAALKITASGAALSVVDAETIAAGIGDDALLGTMTIALNGGATVQIRHLMPGRLAEMILGELNSSVMPVEPAPAPVITESAPPPAAPPQAAAPVQAASAPQASAPAVSSGNVMGPATEFQPATFSQLTPGAESLDTSNLDILLDVPLEVTVELGKTRIPIRQILEYCQGSLITLDKLAGEPIDLLVNGKYFARGEVVVIDENFGVRITSILTPAERIAQLT